jgi:hypothetical protein
MSHRCRQYPSCRAPASIPEIHVGIPRLRPAASLPFHGTSGSVAADELRKWPAHQVIAPHKENRIGNVSLD